ncbi:MAG: 2-C-methyl-D-erythritol 4-phosphate cytidylyltransferase [Defluviitaleaceae bacterium]|nr:2-C-methyl-D-erythritol 4-phosphate cytidylyltransferase [Defluviitaleaceae bacterium]
MYTVILPAAGTGSRMKLGYNKLFHQVADRTVIEHTVSHFLNDAHCTQIIIVTNAHDQAKMSDLFNSHAHVDLILGGNTRQESIYHALEHVKEDVVLVHDGARPFINSRIIHACYETAKSGLGAITAVPLKDTVKKRQSFQTALIEKTLNRARLVATQTPQAFPTSVLKMANARAKQAHTLNEATDDASLVEQYTEIDIKIIDGDYKNMKFTTSEDIAYFEFLMKKEHG